MLVGGKEILNERRIKEANKGDHVPQMEPKKQTDAPNVAVVGERKSPLNFLLQK